MGKPWGRSNNPTVKPSTHGFVRSAGPILHASFLSNHPTIHPTAEPLVSELSTKAINTVRVLSADMVQKANSGHPGYVTDHNNKTAVDWGPVCMSTHPKWSGRSAD